MASQKLKQGRLTNPGFALRVEVTLILFIGALAYLPGLSQATIYRDDWYYTLDRLKGGPAVFEVMFSIDRPARGPFLEVYYRLFGIQPLPYHLVGFLWRWACGLGALALFRLLWPRQRQATLVMSLLFMLYPGYLVWLNGFENQYKIASLCLEVISIVLTLQAVVSTSKPRKIFLWMGAILTGWAYLALVDYAIGMEVFRLLCIYIVTSREQAGLTFTRKIWASARAWAAAALAPAGFLFWRLFIFNNTRPETDIAVQLGALVESPLNKGLWWLVLWLQSTFNTALLPWLAPSFQDFFELRLKTILIGLGLAVLAAGCSLFAIWWLKRTAPPAELAQDSSADPRGHWQVEAVWIGLSGVIFGVVPIILANRYVEFTRFSHYALPASLAAAALITGLVFSLRPPQLQAASAVVLILLAVLTHYTRGALVVEEEATISQFWRQVSWRAPGIRPGTTLVVHYPGVDYLDDYDAVFGPANFIYFPETTDQIPVEYQLAALPQFPWTNSDITQGGTFVETYRTHCMTIDYNNLLVISQPTKNACAHIIDSRWPWTAYEERDWIKLAGSKSNISNVIPVGESPVLLESIFGPPAGNDWCTYFEKAELAIQTDDWETAGKLGSEALESGYHATLAIEWIPFYQAFALLGDPETLEEIGNYLSSTSYNRLQACNTMRSMLEQGYTFNSAMWEIINRQVCTGINN